MGAKSVGAFKVPVHDWVMDGASVGYTGSCDRNAPSLATTDEQATIGPSLVIKGEVSGSEPLYIDGQVEGTITIMENRLTIGRNGSVTANITAKELVLMGKLSGNVNVTERVDIRGEHSDECRSPSHPSDLCGPFDPIDLGHVGLAEVVWKTREKGHCPYACHLCTTVTRSNTISELDSKLSCE